MVNRALRVAAIAVLAPAPLIAQVVPLGQGTTRVVGNRAHSMIAIPIAALTGWDDNHDALLSRDELSRHWLDLQRQASSRFELTSGGRPGKTIADTLLVEPADSGTAFIPGITLSRITEWDAPVERISVRVGLFPDNASKIEFRATRDPRTEVAVLTPASPTHEFFGPPAPAAARPAKRGLSPFVVMPMVVFTIFIALIVWMRRMRERLGVPRR